MSLENDVQEELRRFRKKKKLLQRTHISLEQVSAYHQRYSTKSIITLIRHHISPERANQLAQLYHSRYDSDTVTSFILEDVPLEHIGKSSGYKKLIQNGIKDEEIGRLLKAQCPLKFASRFYPSYSIDELTLWSNGKYPRQDDYLKRFKNRGMRVLLKKGISPDIASKYDEHFSLNDILLLRGARCTPQSANTFGTDYNALEISILFKMGVSQQVAKNKNLLPVLKHFSRLKQKKKPDSYTLLDIGFKSIVVLNKFNKTAYKVSLRDSIEEVNILDLLDKTAKSNHLISYLNVVYRKPLRIIGLRYIAGETLEQILKKRKKLESKSVLKYSGGIFRGLEVLREAGVYHRDLWLGNIMIDFEHDNRAVIIDFGEATLQPNASETGSRRYRGDNDLQTLGQIMYKMATGRNLFNTYPDRSSTTVPDNILTTILRTRSDQDVLEERIQEIERNIPDDRLKEIIRYGIITPSRLDNTNFAVDEAYTKMREMLEGYLADIPTLMKATV